MRDIGTHYDVVIVGGRCAGAATAMLLARAGANVLVVDRQKYALKSLRLIDEHGLYQQVIPTPLIGSSFLLVAFL